jgi:hypothetical protein
MYLMDAPVPPVDMVMPAAAQQVFTVVWGAVALALAGYAGYQGLRHRRWLPAALLLGGAVCYFAEPMVDVLGLLWHPTHGQWVALDTFRAVPLWGLFVYAICFGGLPYLMWLDFRRGFTARRAWTWIGAFWLVDLAVEFPILHFGLYVYYGDPPMRLAGLPLYWLFMNIIGPLATAVAVLTIPALHRGVGLLVAVGLPVSLDAAGSAVVGWPIFSALNAGAGGAVKYLAAAVSVLIGLVLLRGLIRYPNSRWPAHPADGSVAQIGQATVSS